MKTFKLLFLLSFLMVACNESGEHSHGEDGTHTHDDGSTHENHDSDNQDHPEEAVSSYQIPGEEIINQVVLNAYKALEFSENQKPNYDAIRAVFTPDAVFMNFRFDTLSKINLDQFITGYKASVESGNITSFKEAEIHGKTEGFGNIAHRISTYVTYLNNPAIISERGVNSFQLIKMPDGWRVNSVIWDVEKDGQDIPAYYE